MFHRHRGDSHILIADEFYHVYRKSVVHGILTCPVTGLVHTEVCVFLRRKALSVLAECNPVQIISHILMVSCAAAESNHSRVAGVHIESTSSCQERICIVIAVCPGIPVSDALSLQHAVHVVRIAPIGNILLIDLHHNVVFACRNTQLLQIIDIFQGIRIFKCRMSDVKRRRLILFCLRGL